MPTQRHGWGLLVLALATLILELTLTRVLSVAQWYHFGFLVISTALLGFGAAGSTLAAWRRLRESAALDEALAWAAGGFSLAALGAFALMQHVPFDPFAVLADWHQWFYSPLYYMLLTAPFYAAGLGFALLFTRGAGVIGRLYAFDLVGAGLGCATLPLVLPLAGGGGAVALAAALGLLAAAIFVGRRRLVTPGLVAVALALAIAAPAFDRLVPLRITPLKVRPVIAPLETHWNASSRVEVFQLRPPGAPSSMRRFVIDGGTAGTGIQDLRPGVRDYLHAHPDDRDYPSGIAYVGVNHPKVLIIGSGAGVEVLDALHYGARSVTAVEVNPAIVDVVSKRMTDYWGGLFSQPEVQLVLDDGRSFLRRSHEQYDAIISIHTISNAAVASGAMSLSENYVLTREAFEDYIDHLTPDGTLLFSRPEPQLPRIVATAREAFQRRGVSDISDRLYAFRVRPDEGEHRMFGTAREAFEADVLIRKSPFTDDAMREIERIASIGVEGGAPDGTIRDRLYPPRGPLASNIYQTIASTPDLEAFYRRQSRELRPATDDRPYFNHLTRWSSLDLFTVRQMAEPLRVGGFMLGDRPVAEVTLVALLVQSALAAGVFLLLPLRRLPAAATRGLLWRSLVYFAALGLGFITIEMAIISRLTLYLGQPAHTLALILAVLLVSSGAGSALAGRLPPGRTPLAAALLLVLLAFTYGAPSLLWATLGWSFVGRCLIAAVLIAPLGCVLGMPFPRGIQSLSVVAPDLVPWAWGVNGFFTVIGSTASLMFAMTIGFTNTLLLATVCYVAAVLVMPWNTVVTD